jgi:orotidine-5'-phosphate decarboxylase
MTMGMQLMQRYEEIGREMGAVGRMKLAMLTKMTSGTAEKAEDSVSNLRLVEEAMAQLRKGG